MIAHDEHWPRIVEVDEDGRQHGLCEDCDREVVWDQDVKAFLPPPPAASDVREYERVVGVDQPPWEPACRACGWSSDTPAVGSRCPKCGREFDWT